MGTRLSLLHVSANKCALDVSVLVVCSGLLPSLIGIAHVAIQFPLYEACKSWFAQRALQTRDNKELNTLELVTASAVSKMIASTATYPHEVLRSHMHVTGSGPFTGFVKVATEVSRALFLKSRMHVTIFDWQHARSACCSAFGCLLALYRLTNSCGASTFKLCFQLHADLAGRRLEGVLQGLWNQLVADHPCSSSNFY